MGKADLHIHTLYSYDGFCAVSTMLEQAAQIARLDVIAITDHDEIEGALEAEVLGPKFGIHVIPGCEISTREGHLLAYFLRERVPAGRSLVETVLRVSEMGGLCVVAHPEARGVDSISAKVLERALKVPGVSQALVGIEAINSSLIYPESNYRAQGLAARFGLAAVGSSDSHVRWSVGSGITEFAGCTPLDLRTALVTHTTRAVHRERVQPLPLILSYLLGNGMRRLGGWVTWTPAPRAGFSLRRLQELPHFTSL